MKKILYIAFIIFQRVFATDIAKNEALASSLSKNTWEPSYPAMFFGLLLVVGLVYLTAFIYQKLLKVNLVSTADKNNKAEIISTTQLGQNKNLHVIKVNDEYILIGSTQNSITYLKDIDYVE